VQPPPGLVLNPHPLDADPVDWDEEEGARGLAARAQDAELARTSWCGAEPPPHWPLLLRRRFGAPVVDASGGAGGAGAGDTHVAGQRGEDARYHTLGVPRCVQWCRRRHRLPFGSALHASGVRVADADADAEDFYPQRWLWARAYAHDAWARAHVLAPFLHCVRQVLGDAAHAHRRTPVPDWLGGPGGPPGLLLRTALARCAWAERELAALARRDTERALMLQLFVDQHLALLWHCAAVPAARRDAYWAWEQAPALLRAVWPDAFDARGHERYVCEQQLPAGGACVLDANLCAHAEPERLRWSCTTMVHHLISKCMLHRCYVRNFQNMLSRACLMYPSVWALFERLLALTLLGNYRHARARPPLRARVGIYRVLLERRGADGTVAAAHGGTAAPSGALSTQQLHAWVRSRWWLSFFVAKEFTVFLFRDAVDVPARVLRARTRWQDAERLTRAATDGVRAWAVRAYGELDARWEHMVSAERADAVLTRAHLASQTLMTRLENEGGAGDFLAVLFESVDYHLTTTQMMPSEAFLRDRVAAPLGGAAHVRALHALAALVRMRRRRRAATRTPQVAGVFRDVALLCSCAGFQHPFRRWLAHLCVVHQTVGVVNHALQQAVRAVSCDPVSFHQLHLVLLLVMMPERRAHALLSAEHARAQQLAHRRRLLLVPGAPLPLQRARFCHACERLGCVVVSHAQRDTEIDVHAVGPERMAYDVDGLAGLRCSRRLVQTGSGFPHDDAAALAARARVLRVLAQLPPLPAPAARSRLVYEPPPTDAEPPRTPSGRRFMKHRECPRRQLERMRHPVLRDYSDADTVYDAGGQERSCAGIIADMAELGLWDEDEDEDEGSDAAQDAAGDQPPERVAERDFDELVVYDVSDAEQQDGDGGDGKEAAAAAAAAASDEDEDEDRALIDRCIEYSDDADDSDPEAGILAEMDDGGGGGGKRKRGRKPAGARARNPIREALRLASNVISTTRRAERAGGFGGATRPAVQARQMTCARAEMYELPLVGRVCRLNQALFTFCAGCARVTPARCNSHDGPGGGGAGSLLSCGYHGRHLAAGPPLLSERSLLAAVVAADALEHERAELAGAAFARMPHQRCEWCAYEPDLVYVGTARTSSSQTTPRASRVVTRVETDAKAGGGGAPVQQTPGAAAAAAAAEQRGGGPHSMRRVTTAGGVASAHVQAPTVIPQCSAVNFRELHDIERRRALISIQHKRASAPDSAAAATSTPAQTPPATPTATRDWMDVSDDDDAAAAAASHRSDEGSEAAQEEAAAPAPDDDDDAGADAALVRMMARVREAAALSAAGGGRGCASGSDSDDEDEARYLQREMSALDDQLRAEVRQAHSLLKTLRQRGAARMSNQERVFWSRNAVSWSDLQREVRARLGAAHQQRTAREEALAAHVGGRDDAARRRWPGAFAAGAAFAASVAHSGVLAGQAHAPVPQHQYARGRLLAHDDCAALTTLDSYMPRRIASLRDTYPALPLDAADACVQAELQLQRDERMVMVRGYDQAQHASANGAVKGCATVPGAHALRTAHLRMYDQRRGCVRDVCLCALHHHMVTEQMRRLACALPVWVGWERASAPDVLEARMRHRAPAGPIEYADYQRTSASDRAQKRPCTTFLREVLEPYVLKSGIY